MSNGLTPAGEHYRKYGPTFERAPTDTYRTPGQIWYAEEQHKTLVKRFTKKNSITINILKDVTVPK